MGKMEEYLPEASTSCHSSAGACADKIVTSDKRISLEKKVKHCNSISTKKIAK